MRGSSAADVLVSSSSDERTLRSLLRANPYVEFVVGISDVGVLVLASDGRTSEFSVVGTGCLAADELWRAVVESLHTWWVAGLDLALLRRHGLPLWCPRHRREPSPCRRLHPAQPRRDPPGAR
ncbi:hypothetical protein AB0I60_15720 [Actinosynnema sp. NPDC050436]|uniref:hypothetical protein n=1 Tax=Actinosynnema sp. NPDC050436 TaxID=3155659 RepID=UPI00340DB35B